ncbi:MAG: hypothetical protein ABI587_00365 [Gemmatimonadales bacterium]
MSFLALLSSPHLLGEMVRTGEAPLVVLGRNRTVTAAAHALGLPALHVDDLFRRDERVALQDHVDDLSRHLAGAMPVSPKDYQRWGWWALEYAFANTLSHGARTRRLIEAGLTLAPGAQGIVHDGDGFAHGAVVTLAARERGLVALGFPPQAGGALHTAQDMALTPLAKEGACEDWRGLALPADRRLTVVTFHANEIAQCFGPLREAPDLRIVMDRRDPWSFGGPAVDATPVGPARPLIVPHWPALHGITAAPWEREICEHLFITYQPWLRESLHWALAAYRAGEVRALLGAQDFLPHMRTRMLACRTLGIPTILMQHGAYHAHRPAGRGDRNHQIADHTLTWSRAVSRELTDWGLTRPTHVIGWPQGTAPIAGEAAVLRAASASVERPWVVLATGSSSDTAELPYDQGTQFLAEVLPALRAARPDVPIVLKGHPFYDSEERLAELCRTLGISGVTIQVGQINMWEVVAGAAAVIGTKSTSVFSAAALGVPVAVYYPFEDEPWFDRYADTPVARTPAALTALLQRDPVTWNTSPGASVRQQFRTDVRAARRLVAVVRKIARGSESSPSVSARRADTVKQKRSCRTPIPRQPGVAIP